MRGGINDIFSRIRNLTHNSNLKAGALYTIYSFVYNGLNFVLMLILAKFLTPSDYGSLNLFSTLVQIIGIIISLCTTSYVGIIFFQKDRETLRKVIWICFIVTSVILGILSLVLLLAHDFMVGIVGIGIQYQWLALFICYFQVFTALNLDIFRLEEKIKSYGIYTITQGILNFILTFFFIIGMKCGWEGRVYALFLTGCAFFVLSIILMYNSSYLKPSIFSRSLVKETLIFSLPIIPHLASFWLKQGMDRYIIKFFYGTTEVGFYSFAMNLAAIIAIIGNAFNSSNSVYIYKKLSDGYDKAKETLRKQTMLVSIVFVVVSALVILFSWNLIHFFLSKYTKSIEYIIPLGIGAFFQCIYLLYVNYLFYHKKTVTLMSITLTTGLIQLGLSLWLTRYSVLYTAYISMGISILTAFIVMMFAKKYNRESLA